MLKPKLIKSLCFYSLIFICLFLVWLIYFLLTPPVAPNNNFLLITIPSPIPSVPLETNPSPKVSTRPQITPSIFKPTPIPSLTPVTNPKTNNSISPMPTQDPTNQINVSLNGSSNFTVVLNQGANQCDVLNKSLAEGKILSLNMRYDSNFGTYAVYQINGTGKENSVWWTFKVNGQSPNQGCSYIKANNNDNVEWIYQGS